MNKTDKVTHRLALLEGASLAPDDLESVVKDIEDNERIVAELEEFSQAVPWVAMPLQPSSKKA